MPTVSFRYLVTIGWVMRKIDAYQLGVRYETLSSITFDELISNKTKLWRYNGEVSGHFPRKRKQNQE